MLEQLKLKGRTQLTVYIFRYWQSVIHIKTKQLSFEYCAGLTVQDILVFQNTVGTLQRLYIEIDLIWGALWEVVLGEMSKFNTWQLSPTCVFSIL